MTEHHEGHQSSYQRLQAQKSLKEILDIATEFERTAHAFYAALIPKVSKQLRYLVEELAAEEQAHYALFQKLAQNPALEQQINSMVQTPVNDHGFSDCIHLPNLGEHPDDQAVLQYALHREHNAMEQYTALADSTAPGPVQELFRYLAQEETKHKTELEKLYYQVVHRGGV